MSTPTDRPTERPADRGDDHTRRRLGLVRERRLAVDRVACSGHGVCAQLLAGVTLDEWGYPVVADDRVGEDGRAVADTAVRLCPARALYLR
ncbi:ferredoxin [Terracoccus sp. 273MFTsu3.1]|uniref:ferredoxin n=1 Tax=Terracoccus sp. 273MFTsu3.1 TaxID=1172188 RepID=UPI00037448DA|nr:ferredoxin [Terracoccus sp. 273MFTsu3.1]